ncbi:MAG TPA: hypothetical protein VKM55_20145 [Candidatus Lokiarchaeia archaeon]|nr:hypothetical protein [Candidatus Lokiarchaeia archaeon]
MESCDPASQWKEEQAEVKALYNLVKNGNETVRYKIDPNVLGKLKEQYAAVVEEYIQRYKEEFETYFASNSASLLAFDLEEINTWGANTSFTICIIGIQINPGLDFELYFDSIRRPPCDAETKNIDERFSRWLHGKTKAICLLTHGSNQKEHQITAKMHNCETQNTETLLLEILKHANHPEPQKPNIHAFEQVIGFERYGCIFIKHCRETDIPRKSLAKLFPLQARISMWRLSAGKEPRACKVCNKPQDVFLYCLEDTFVTILIHVHYRNHVAPTDNS